MKKLVISVLSLLLVGVCKANAETKLYYHSEFLEVSIEKCYAIVSGITPSKLIMTKGEAGDTVEYHLVKDKVYRFTLMQFDSATQGEAFTLSCQVALAR